MPVALAPAASSPSASAASLPSAATLEVALPQATLRFAENWNPAQVAALVRLLGA